MPSRYAAGRRREYRVRDKLLRGFGAVYRTSRSRGAGRGGVPVDLIALGDGMFLLVEVKTSRGQITGRVYERHVGLGRRLGGAAGFSFVEDGVYVFWLVYNPYGDRMVGLLRRCFGERLSVLGKNREDRRR